MWKISTHALTEGDIITEHEKVFVCISTHALTEGDGGVLFFQHDVIVFQLTPSQRATTLPITSEKPHRISTHALTEGDNPAIL